MLARACPDQLDGTEILRNIISKTGRAPTPPSDSLRDAGTRG